MKRPATWIVLFLALLLTTESRAEAPKSPLPAIRIVVIGDSTVATYKKNGEGRWNIAGWGQFLGDAMNDSVTVINHAKSGRSSSSFVWEGRWTKALADRPDYVFIQFGHNDCPGKGIRETDPNTSYRDYLRKYIYYARAAHAKPILVTPMERRRFGDDGRLKPSLQAYADAMLAVGKEQNVPVVDLHAASVDLFNRLGDAGSADLSCNAKDRTHFSEKGARTLVRLIVEQLRVVEPTLRPYLKSTPTASGHGDER